MPIVASVHVGFGQVIPSFMGPNAEITSRLGVGGCPRPLKWKNRRDIPVYEVRQVDEHSTPFDGDRSDPSEFPYLAKIPFPGLFWFGVG
jgi:hypothetical protein